MNKNWLFSLCLLTAFPAFGQIPVTDSASIAKSIEHQIETVTKWKQQYDQMQNQINSMTGSRGLGQILNDPTFQNYIPNEWQGVYDNIRSMGYAGMTPSAKVIYDRNKVYDRCASLTQQRKTRCESESVLSAQTAAFIEAALDTAKTRIDQIGGLMQQINQTNDPKSIAELQGRIGAEQAMIQNEMSKIKMFEMMMQANKELQAEQRRQASIERSSRKKGLTIPDSLTKF